jgi:prevent-host-death family protein
MRTVTATEASRAFAALLDEVEHGETVVVTRGGKRIATIGPAGAGNGAAVRGLLLGAVPDRSFARAVRQAREVAAFDGVVWPED